MLRRSRTRRIAAGWRAALLFWIILIAVALACGPLGSSDDEEPGAAESATVAVDDAPDEESEPAPTAAPEEPTLAPVEEETTDEPPADEEMLSVLDLDTSDDVESYRMRMVLESSTTADDGTTSTDTFTLEGAQNFAADEATYTISGSTLQGVAGDSITMARIGQDQYLILPEGSCISYNLPADDITEVFFEQDGLIFTSLNNLRRVLPNETINGVETRHYVFDEESITAADEAMVNLTSVSGDVYLAMNNNRVIRIAMTGRGAGFGLVEETAESEVSYQIDFFDFDQVGEIEIPEGCTAPADTAYPVLDDAQDLFQGAGILTYNTGYSVDEAVLFYQETLRDQGWSGGENTLAGTGAGLLNFTRGDEQIVITIAADADGGRTSVAIVPAP